MHSREARQLRERCKRSVVQARVFRSMVEVSDESLISAMVVVPGGASAGQQWNEPVPERMIIIMGVTATRRASVELNATTNLSSSEALDEIAKAASVVKGGGV